MQTNEQVEVKEADKGSVCQCEEEYQYIGCKRAGERR